MFLVLSQLYGDYLYDKGDYSGAMAQYKLTAEHLASSYVIRSGPWNRGGD